MTAVTVRGLVLARADDEGVGLRVDDHVWTWAEVVDGARIRAGWMHALAPRDGRERPHVGVLMDNVAEFPFLLAAAALADATLVGLNATRQGAELARDVDHTDCDVVLAAGAHVRAARALDLDVEVVDVDDPSWRERLGAHADAPLPSGSGDPQAPFVLILTSGTTSAPKAVVCSAGKIGAQGSAVARIVELTSDDTSYVSMPLFHSNAIIAGWGPTVAAGATLALRERFSASSFIADVRRYGATYANYVGTPLSYVLAQPSRDDDADNPLRVVFGNEGAPADIPRFAERFGCRVIDGYGSTEGGLSIARTPDTPEGALGVGVGDVRVLDPDTGAECVVARLDEAGRLLNADEAIGELVNLGGRGAFEGYWANADAEADRVREGRYHSGDLGYRDADGFLWFAGRTDDWLRIGGENVGVGAIQRVLSRHRHVIEACVVGVPDATAGDQVLAALVTTPDFDAGEFVTWLQAEPDLAARCHPRYLRVVDDLPRTGTGKVLRRQVRTAAWLPADTLVVDDEGPRPLGAGDREELRRAFATAGRAHVHPGGES